MTSMVPEIGSVFLCVMGKANAACSGMFYERFGKSIDYLCFR